MNDNVKDKSERILVFNNKIGEDHTSSSCLFEKASYSAKASSSAGSKCANLQNLCNNELTIVIII